MQETGNGAQTSEKQSLHHPGPAEPPLMRDGFGFLTQAVAQGIEHRMFQGVNSVISKSSSFLRGAGKAWE